MSSKSRPQGRGPPGKSRSHDGDRGAAEEQRVERRKDPDSGRDGGRREETGRPKQQKQKHPREDQPSGNAERRKADKQRREAQDAARKEQKKREEEEKARLEEQRKKEEEEKRQHEEQLRKEEEERRQKEEEEQHARDTLAEIVSRNKHKMATRQTNLAAKEHRPDETALRTFDSSVKKNTTFVKKLRSVTEQQRDALSAEFNQLNLSKYIQEAVTSFAEAKLKMADVGAAVHLCGLFHQRYADFSKLLLPAVEKIFAGGMSKDKPPNVSLFRVTLRFFGELVVSGVFENGGISNLLHVFTIVVHADKDSHAYLLAVLSFCRHCGEDLAGLVSRKQRSLLSKFNLEQEKTESFLPADKQMLFKKQMFDYYQTLCDHVMADLKAVQKVERRNRHIMLTKGEVSNERQEEAETLRKAYEKLLSNTTALADVLDKELPDLPEDDVPEASEMGGVDFVKAGEGGSGEGSLSLWEDEDARTFYESLIDLKSVVPGILFKEKEKEKEGSKSSAGDGSELSSAATGTGSGDADDVMLEEAESDAAIEAMIEDLSLQEQEPVVIEEPEGNSASNQASGASSAGKLLDDLITRLPQCVNRDMIDDAATDFCLHMNTKSNRNRLIKALFTVRRSRLDMLPFCGRFVATLDPCLPDIAIELCQWIKKDFRFLIFKKGQTNIESKIKCVRYMGELTKFKLMPKADTLHSLKILLHDFTHHNIEMACQLLETCGRFLYRSPDSHLRTKIFLDTMMRKKAALHLDGRQITMIDNAFHYCNPPDVPKASRKVRPPMHEYIRKLLLKDLNRQCVEKVLRQVRKFPWKDPEVKEYGVKCFTRVWRLKYSNIQCLANVLSGLELYQDEFALRVIDGILEEIRIGMETNSEKHNQRRLAVVRFLGEMYNYRLVEAAVIFRTLYMFLGFGNTPDGSPSPVDPPDNYFRIRLVCSLLDTCGMYFDHGSAKKKLDAFLIFFQLYMFYKESPPPLEIEFLFSDTLEQLRPKLKAFANKEDAMAAANELETEFKARRVKLLQKDKSAGNQAGNDVVSSEMSGFGLLSRQQDAEDGYEDDSDSDNEDATGPRRGTIEYGDDMGSTEEEGMLSQDDEQEVVLRNGPKRIDCPEDDDFLADFDKLMNDNVATRRTDAPVVPVFDLPMPVANSRIEEPSSDGKLKFSLILKRGNKQVRRGLDVSENSEIATVWREHRQADVERDRKERRELKQYVLEYEQRQEEEAYTESLGDLQKPVQPRVHHQRSGGGGEGGGGNAGNPRYYDRDRRPLYGNRGPQAPASIHSSSPFPAPGPRKR
ncbi:regulator of nonsense transcripts 2-like [Sycon ciliatum]|uniref:regulator of nonsense transcripts 2-like n=1 Tax=Sycon ciliatum TaxID=27933 RepID=UPI0031F6B28C